MVRAIYTNMLAMCPEGCRIVPVCASRHQPFVIAPRDFLSGTGAESRNLWMEAEPQSGDIFLGLDLSAHILPRWERLLRRWRADGVTIHFVVFDLLPWSNPQWFRPRAVRNFRRWLKLVVRQADSALCISRTVAEQFAEYVKVSGQERLWSGKLHVIRLGWDVGASSPSTGISKELVELAARMKGNRIALMVGTVEPRKAHEAALAAMECLWENWDPPYWLVIAGKPGWKTEALQSRLRAHPEMGKRLWWIDDASDEAVQLLYRCASGVLFTSRAEGYGLPVGEALASNKPVLARDLPVLRELFAGSLEYFTDDSPKQLSQTIAAWLERAEAGRAFVGVDILPSWQESAADVFAALGLFAERDRSTGGGQ